MEALDFTSLRFMAEEVEGSFCFTILDAEDNMYFVKGDNPLCLYHYPRLGLYIYASTEAILTKAIRRMGRQFGLPEKVSLEAGDILNLLYVSLLALEKDSIPDERVRYAFEVRLMVMSGEFPTDITVDDSLLAATRQAFYHMITAPLGKLFSFEVTDPVMQEIRLRQDRLRARSVDRSFHSLEVLDSMLKTVP